MLFYRSVRARPARTPPSRPASRTTHGPLLRDLRQGVDGRLQPPVVGDEPRPRPPPLPAEPPAARHRAEGRARRRRSSARAAGAPSSSRPSSRRRPGDRRPTCAGSPRPDRPSTRRPASSCPARSVRSGAIAPASAIVGVEPDRERAVVDELDRHLGTEPARSPRSTPSARKRRRRTAGRAARPAPARRAPVNPGRRPRRVSAYSVNCDTTSAAPPTSSSDRFVRPSSSRKMRSSATLRARSSATVSVSSGPTPSRMTSPGPIAPTTSPSTRTAARSSRWRSALTGGSGGGMTPCSAMNAARQASASRS